MNDHIEIMLARSAVVVIGATVALTALALILPIITDSDWSPMSVLSAFLAFAGAFLGGYLTYRTKTVHLSPKNNDSNE